MPKSGIGSDTSLGSGSGSVRTAAGRGAAASVVGMGLTPDDRVTDARSGSFCSLAGAWLPWSPFGTLTEIVVSAVSPATAFSSSARASGADANE
jgi:hypothetical protein